MILPTDSHTTANRTTSGNETSLRSVSLPLTKLTIHLSDESSLACRRCWDPALPVSIGNVKHYLPVDRIGTAVREALPLGLTTVRLSGGEPLLYPDFDLLLDRLESLELCVEIETTGSGMTPVRAARLARLPQCIVSIGLDGAEPATHDALYQRPGGFEIATHAARLLATAGLAPQIVTLIRRRNSGQIPALIRLVEELGGASITFALPDHRQITGLNAETLTVEELIALGRRIERDLAHTTPLNLLFEQPPAFRGLQPMARIIGQGRCNILTALGVLPSGEYALCGAAENVPDLIFGQVGVVPLERIWNEHPILRTLREGIPDRLDGVCGRCVLKTACMGNCATENYLRGGTFWGPYWFCAAAEQAGLFPAGRIIENAW